MTHEPGLRSRLGTHQDFACWCAVVASPLPPHGPSYTEHPKCNEVVVGDQITCLWPIVASWTFTCMCMFDWEGGHSCNTQHSGLPPKCPPTWGGFSVPSGESCQDWWSVPLTRDPYHPSGPPKCEGGMGEGTFWLIAPLFSHASERPLLHPLPTHAIPPKPHFWQKWALPLAKVSNGGSNEPTYVYIGPWEVGAGRCPHLLCSHGHFSRTSAGPGQRNIGRMKKVRPPC